MSAWLLRPGLSTCNACHGRLVGAWMWQADRARFLYCRACALVVCGQALPDYLNWRGWSQFKPREHNAVHNRFAGVRR